VSRYPSDASRDQLDSPGMGARPRLKAQEGSVVKHPRIIDGERSAAEPLVTGKLSWQEEGDFCEQDESAAQRFKMPSPPSQEWQGGRIYCSWHF